MSIRPIDFGVMMQRTPEAGMQKQNADNKPVFEQQVLSNKIQKDTQQNLRQVNESEDAQNYQKKYDAKEKGSNEYQPNQKNRKGKKEEKGERVIQKPSYSGFDISI